MTSHSDSAGPLASGDLVLLDYELWAEGGGRTELVGTTREEIAQKAEIHLAEGQTFGPQPHLIGGDEFPAGLENALVGAKIGAEFEKEVDPADGFGERDPKLIELYSMHEISRLPEMRREDAHLDMGTVLTIEGRRGRVVTLTAARVRVDFNHPYAGKKIKAKFKVLERIAEPAEQVRALIDLTYGRAKEFHIEVKAGHVNIRVPDRAKFDARWILAKPALVDRVRGQLKPEKITVSEEYITPVKKVEKTEEAEAKPAPKSPDPNPVEEKSDAAPAESHAGHSHAKKA
jgi:FKBP-type peptidyl-prolyl cis-trans isomerase 2